jgi:hypothetical protein
MKRSILFFIVTVVSFSLLFSQPSHIPVTRLISPDNSILIDYHEWLKTIQNTEPVSVGNVGVVERDGGKINLIVNSTLYPKLLYFLNPSTGQFVTDLVNDGWTVSVDTMAMSSNPFAPETLRNFLISEYGTGSVGAIFIGDLPIAWFQMMEVFWGSPPSYTDFPIDLFYMDMDGTWEDNYKEQGGNLVAGTDSIYDTHTGDMGTEIFMGRLTAGTCGNDSTLIHQYLDRNHNYRTGSLSLSKEALLYVDDDWEPWSSEYYSQLGAVYDSILMVDHPETTTATDWRTRLPVSHEWVSVYVHSWPGGHSFKYNNGNSWDWFYSTEIPGINPVANFYNLFACSNARYTETDNCGGMYTFRNDYGLGALGSTKTGSMLEFQYFYNPLSQGKCIGDAFAEWFTIMGNVWGDTSRSWFYGMTFIGDASLIVKDSLTAISERPENKEDLVSIHVSPNPASEYVLFRINGNMKKATEITIYGMDGRVVWKKNAEHSSSVRWDCRTVSSGIYFCTVNTPQGVFTEKVTLFK